MQTVPHALNKGFTWKPAVLGNGKMLSDEQIESFNKNGYCVLKQVISREELKGVRDACDAADERMEMQMEKVKKENFAITRKGKFTVSTHVASQSKKVKRFANGQMFKNICLDLMGVDVQLYHDQLVYKKQDKRAHFPWHQDNGYIYVEPQQYITCWIPLVDATEANGCPWVIPGLHKQGTLEHKKNEFGFVCVDELMPEEALCCPVEAGDVLVFSSLCPHMTGPNKTDEVRKSYIVQYASKTANRVLYNRESGQRYFSLRINTAIDYFIMRQVMRPFVAKLMFRFFGSA